MVLAAVATLSHRFPLRRKVHVVGLLDYFVTSMKIVKVTSGNSSTN